MQESERATERALATTREDMLRSSLDAQVVGRSLLDAEAAALQERMRAKEKEEAWAVQASALAETTEEVASLRAQVSLLSQSSTEALRAQALAASSAAEEHIRAAEQAAARTAVVAEECAVRLSLEAAASRKEREALQVERNGLAEAAEVTRGEVQLLRQELGERNLSLTRLEGELAARSIALEASREATGRQASEGERSLDLMRQSLEKLEASSARRVHAGTLARWFECTSTCVYICYLLACVLLCVLSYLLTYRVRVDLLLRMHLVPTNLLLLTNVPACVRSYCLTQGTGDDLRADGGRACRASLGDPLGRRSGGAARGCGGGASGACAEGCGRRAWRRRGVDLRIERPPSMPDSMQ